MRCSFPGPKEASIDAEERIANLRYETLDPNNIRMESRIDPLTMKLGTYPSGERNPQPTRGWNFSYQIQGWILRNSIRFAKFARDSKERQCSQENINCNLYLSSALAMYI